MAGNVLIGAVGQGHDLLDWLSPIFTLLGVIVVGFYTYYAKEQNKLTEKAMIYGNRSWLVATQRILRGSLVISVTNTGGVPALIWRQGVSEVNTQRGAPPDPPDLSSDEQELDGQVVLVNDGRPVPMVTVAAPTFAKQLPEEWRGAVTEIYIFYYAVYTDCFEKRWTTVTCWRCDSEHPEWRPEPRYTRLL